MSSEHNEEIAAKGKGRAYWESQVKQWQTSGLSQQGFCKRHGIRYTLFNQWKVRLVDKRSSGLSISTSKGRSAFVPLHASPTDAISLQLVLPNGIRVQCAGCTDVGYLGALVTALNR